MSQLRHPKGTPGSRGGQFAPSVHSQGEDLDGTWDAPFSLDGEDTAPDSVWDVFPGATPPDADTDGSDREEVRWSFIPGWEQAEKTFTERLSDMPARFFSTDITGKLGLSHVPGWDGNVEASNEIEADVQHRIAQSRLGYGKTQNVLCQAASEPDDWREQTLEDTRRLAEGLGFENLRTYELSSGETLYGNHGGQTFLLRSEPKGKEFGHYYYKNMRGFCLPDKKTREVLVKSQDRDDLYKRIEGLGCAVVDKNEWYGEGRLGGGRVVFRKPDGVLCEASWREHAKPPLSVNVKKQVPDDFPQRFVNISARTLAGVHRIRQATGRNVFDLPEDFDLDAYRGVIEDTLRMQEFGANVIAQRKYADNTGKKLASAWMDKKYPNKTHVEAAEESVLHGAGFGKIEIDNDVDLGEFRDFEKAVLEAQKVLPPIPFKCAPDLRIRKLGKHRALGMYVPHVNTICVDIHDSGSFVHEYGHMLDFQGLESSLGDGFREVTTGYKTRLKDSGNKWKYYTTPTEIWARAFELYAVEKLGINNRLVHDGKHYREFDYAPFHEDPELKTRAFKLFDSLYEQTDVSSPTQ